jgi:hypothetical protein
VEFGIGAEGREDDCARSPTAPAKAKHTATTGNPGRRNTILIVSFTNIILSDAPTALRIPISAPDLWT